jgi:hypothetical protein
MILWSSSALFSNRTLAAAADISGTGTPEYSIIFPMFLAAELMAGSTPTQLPSET